MLFPPYQRAQHHHVCCTSVCARRLRWLSSPRADDGFLGLGQRVWHVRRGAGCGLIGLHSPHFPRFFFFFWAQDEYWCLFIARQRECAIHVRYRPAGLHYRPAVEFSAVCGHTASLECVRCARDHAFPLTCAAVITALKARTATLTNAYVFASSQSVGISIVVPLFEDLQPPVFFPDSEPYAPPNGAQLPPSLRSPFAHSLAAQALKVSRAASLALCRRTCFSTSYRHC